MYFFRMHEQVAGIHQGWFLWSWFGVLSALRQFKLPWYSLGRCTAHLHTSVEQLNKLQPVWIYFAANSSAPDPSFQAETSSSSPVTRLLLSSPVADLKQSISILGLLSVWSDLTPPPPTWGLLYSGILLALKKIFTMASWRTRQVDYFFGPSAVL